MPNFITALVLGVVEGVTEFLPISSTGHLILVNRWFTFGEPFTKLFDIVIQGGAILAVVVLFWRDLWPKAWTLKALKEQWGSVLLAFVPTGFIAWLLNDWVQENLFFSWVVALALVLYGIVFIVIERSHIAEKAEQTGLPSFKHALLIGLAQSLALVPGTSRSGVTILAMLLLGYARPMAAKFSFLLAVPTLLVASGYSLLKYEAPISGEQVGLLAVGFAVSFVVAYAVSKWLMGYIRHKSFEPFGWYRIILGVLVLIAAFFGV